MFTTIVCYHNMEVAVPFQSMNQRGNE